MAESCRWLRVCASTFERARDRGSAAVCGPHATASARRDPHGVDRPQAIALGTGRAPERQRCRAASPSIVRSPRRRSSRQVRPASRNRGRARPDASTTGPGGLRLICSMCRTRRRGIRASRSAASMIASGCGAPAASQSRYTTATQSGNGVVPRRNSLAKARQSFEPVRRRAREAQLAETRCQPRRPRKSAGARTESTR